MKKNERKQKVRLLLPFLGVLLLAIFFVFCFVQPDFFWSVKNGVRVFYRKRILLASLVTLVGILVCFGRFRQKESSRSRNALICVLATPIVVFLMLEYANPGGASLIWRKITLVTVSRSLVTVLILYVILALLFAITNSSRFAGCLLCGLGLGFGVANYYVTSFRNIPLLASDLTSLGTAMNVAGDYDYGLDFPTLLLIISMIVWGILLLRIGKVRLPNNKKRIAYAAGSVLLFALSGWALIGTPFLRQTLGVKINTFRPIKSYRNNGEILTFIRSIQLMIVEKPEDYSLAAAEEIAQPYRDAAQTDTDVYVSPNVIVVMDEAFADLQALGDLETNEEVLPYYNSLTENTVKGSVYVSVFGGQTANTEFEFLTGLSKAFIPESATPYQLYIKSLLPGLTTTLAGRGYQGLIAMHPFKASGYNRANVYPNLGFSDFISKEDMTIADEDLIRNHLSDEGNFELIIEEYEKAKAQSDDPFYLFNVTMQNHSPYNRDWDNLDSVIDVDGGDPQLNRYLNLVHCTDAALETLISYFEEVDDPTVIVFFGDHEPGLSDDIYSSILGKDVADLTNKENMELYKTPFFIWANYDIEEQEDVSISINYLSTLMAESTGMELSPFQQFLSDVAREVPILTANGYFGNDGNFYSLSDESSPYYSLLEEYHLLEYNTLFDQKHRIAGFFG